ncbi:MAG: hypothetical protein Q9201_007740 [Fulgogasparrea decipioides]
MSDTQPDHDEAISQFSALTGVAPFEARRYLEANQWDLPAAAAEYYTSLEEASIEEQPPLETTTQEHQNLTANPPSAPGGGRALGGENVPQSIPTTSSMSDQPASSSRAAPKKFATLGDLSGGSGAGHGGHGHDHDSDDSDSDPKQDLFAGGEKSGLAVQNPDDLKKKILERARK